MLTEPVIRSNLPTFIREVLAHPTALGYRRDPKLPSERITSKAGQILTEQLAYLLGKDSKAGK